MDHLGDAARSELNLSDEEGIQSVKRRRWYGYPAADRILRQFQELYDWPRGPRMPCFLLVGASGNGKTTILNKFHVEHPMCDNPSGEGKVVPTLLVQAPPSADENQFYNDCLDRICAQFNRRGHVTEKRSQLTGLLSVVGVRMLLIDELHSIASGHGSRQQHFLVALKYLTNELQVPLVCAGTDEALSAIEADDQMKSRFTVLSLPLWREGEELSRLLDSFEYRTPLRKPSNLASEDTANLILGLSGGTFSGILGLVRQAAIRAIETRIERITPELIMGSDERGDDSIEQAG